MENVEMENVSKQWKSAMSENQKCNSHRIFLPSSKTKFHDRFRTLV